MSIVCDICATEFEPPHYKYIYCLINTRTKACNYFEEQPIFAFDYDFLKVELRKVEAFSEEHKVSIANT